MRQKNTLPFAIRKEEKMVVLLGDKETQKVASICKERSMELGKENTMKFSDFLDEHGVIDREPFDTKGSIKIYSSKKEGS